MYDRIDHVGIAVEDLEAELVRYRDAFELELEHRERVEGQGVDAALVGIGEGHLELLAPLSAETPVGRFLAKRGPGVHHVAYQVRDIDTALATVKRAGMRLIDERPRKGIRDSQVAFLHPSGAGGVLTEIVQPAREERRGEPPAGPRIPARRREGVS